MKGRESGMPDEAVWASFFDAPAVLDAFGLRADDAVVDFGSGYGTFALPAAAATRGTVHAFDIEPSLVARLDARAAAAGHANLRALQRDFLATGMPDLGRGIATLALAFNILHVEHPERLLAAARDVLTSSGRLAVMHWRSDIETPRGPPLAMRPRPEQVVRWVEAAGFGTAREITLGAAAPWHYGLLVSR